MSKSWTIRETKISDAQAFFSLIFVGWLDSYVNEDLGVTRDFLVSKKLHQLEYSFYRDEMKAENFENSKDNIHFVAEDEKGLIIGFVHGLRNDDGQHLQGLYIYKEMHGTGLAQDLAAKFSEWEDKETDSQVHVVEYNARAIRFYEKMGFRATGKKDTVADIIPCIHMIKKNVKASKVGEK